MRWRRIVMLAAVPLLLSSCSEEWPLAISTAGDALVVHVPECSTKSVDRVELSLYEGGYSYTLWEIESDSSEGVMPVDRQFVVGAEPDGFTTLRPLDKPLDPRRRY